MSNSKLVLPVALGLSLVTVTAFVVYYVFKKDEDGEDKKIKSSRVNVIEVSVPKKIVPALIGRNGSNVKDIEKKSGALIHFKKFSDKEYDVCIIRGRTETTQLAETLIHDFINHQPVIEEDSITVPGWACGRIIGQGGESITEISHRSGARVKVEGQPGDLSVQRQVSFRGTRQQIDMAKGLVESCVNQEKCRREIEKSRRSPRHGPSQSPSQSPSPTPSLHASEPSEEPPGESHTTHARQRRPEATGPIEIYVSAVSSPSRFWVQLVGPQVAQLDELVEMMTEYYGKKENREAHTLSRVSVGQLVAAVFRHDGRWYRARVDDIRPNEFDATQQVADVFFLDYGDSEYVATHELCELRTDMLRLRFQAMECFLAGVRPAAREDANPVSQFSERWHPQAIERFEELTQVARWKALLSRTSTYRRSSTTDGAKEKEIPGMKLYDVTDEGEVDIGGVLVSEGWAVLGVPSPRATPPRGHTTPFGDLGHSKVLSMTEPVTPRSASLPKDHKDDGTDVRNNNDDPDDKMASAKSLASGLEKSDKLLSISNFDLSYPENTQTKAHLNGTHEDFINKERLTVEKEASSETLVPTPNLAKSDRDEFKANMNRIESHHSNLEALGKSQVDLHKF